MFLIVILIQYHKINTLQVTQINKNYLSVVTVTFGIVLDKCPATNKTKNGM